MPLERKKERKNIRQCKSLILSYYLKHALKQDQTLALLNTDIILP